MGADYKVSFDDDGQTENRKVLYRLENLGVVVNEKVKKPSKDGGQWVLTRWFLTEKGREICKKYEYLFTLWEEGKIFEFEKEIEKFLN